MRPSRFFFLLLTTKAKTFRKATAVTHKLVRVVTETLCCLIEQGNLFMLFFFKLKIANPSNLFEKQI